METKKVAFFDTKPYDRVSFEEAVKKYNVDFSFKFFTEKLKEDTAILAKGYDAVCAFVNDSINESVLNKLNEYGIEHIALRCAGYNNVDLKTAKETMKISRVPAYSPEGVAEHAVALMLSLNRKIHRAYVRTRENNFNINGFLGFNMNGKTAGIVGTGKIGQNIIKILKGFGMNILAYDLYPNEGLIKDYGVEYVDLDTLYEKSDIISLHCPLTKDSYHMINSFSIEKMKKNVIIINTSRGQLIYTKDLVKALKNKEIGGAGLDVYEEESDYFFEDFSGDVLEDDILARLLTFNNVLVTSHQAFFTKEALDNIAQTTLENLKEFFETGEIKNEIDYLS